MIGNIVFRVDSSKKSGFGHIMRCFALAEELTRRGNSCFFLSEEIDNNLQKKFQKSHIVHQNMITHMMLEKDIDYVVRFSKENRAQWIITDHYGIDHNFINNLKKQRFHVLCIDDTSQMHYMSDMVVNQNIGADKLKFSAEKYTKFLLGTKYVMLRDEILKRNKKKNRNSVKKILIMLGGTDPDNLTLKILKSLEKINKNYEIFVIIGLFNPFYKKLRTYSDKLKANIKLLKSPENMADLYLKSDLAISAGGSSCYELSYFGIPNLIITIAENQINSAKAFDKQKISMYLGDKKEISKKYIEEKVKELINNQSLRKKMSYNGRKLVDGKGKIRIVEFMESLN